MYIPHNKPGLLSTQNKNKTNPPPKKKVLQKVKPRGAPFTSPATRAFLGVTYYLCKKFKTKTPPLVFLSVPKKLRACHQRYVIYF